jgi:hypothetical protein
MRRLAKDKEELNDLFFIDEATAKEKRLRKQVYLMLLDFLFLFPSPRFKLLDSLTEISQVLHEILNTEKEYVKGLDVLIFTFLLPLRASKDKLGLTDQDLLMLFSNVEMLRPIHVLFLDGLSAEFQKCEKSEGEEPSVGNLFVNLASSLKIYTQYCTSYPKAVSHHHTLSKDNLKYSKHLRTLENDPSCRNLNLVSWMIKPVQRLCKYPLLLRELISHTPEGHSNFANVENAKKKLDEAVDIVNEGKREAERHEKMMEIQGFIGGICGKSHLLYFSFWSFKVIHQISRFL